MHKTTVREYALMTVGAFLIGFTIKNIYDPMGLVTGGASGIAIILRHLCSIPLWVTNTAVNIPLFLAAARVKGWDFIKRTMAATAALSLSLYILPDMPFLMDDLFLTSLFGGLISGAGLGLVFSGWATTGGTDTLASLIQKYLPYYSLAQVTQALDALIVAAGMTVFGIKYALYALIAVYTAAKVCDGIVEGMKFSKIAFVISEKSEEIADAVMREMNRGITGMNVTGMYSGKQKNMLFCVCSRKEIVQFKDLVIRHDSQAFMTVSDAREVLGEGFIEFKQEKRT